ncbi:hypothetical protein NDN08_006329 [Rhodosorus marinus]|uniref:Pericentrin/AKAP-450 centrosomal targeting domain-containing protein n=1 Tax=Rhodosorus marinus TaxID=101924 RepID=A0AAV8UN63_9RHOD|nr:hypothetical protein NDN08_006329 [Rhodosorus marinus]
MNLSEDRPGVTMDFLDEFSEGTGLINTHDQSELISELGHVEDSSGTISSGLERMRINDDQCEDVSLPIVPAESKLKERMENKSPLDALETRHTNPGSRASPANENASGGLASVYFEGVPSASISSNVKSLSRNPPGTASEASSIPFKDVERVMPKYELNENDNQWIGNVDVQFEPSQPALFEKTVSEGSESDFDEEFSPEEEAIHSNEFAQRLMAYESRIRALEEEGAELRGENTRLTHQMKRSLPRRCEVCETTEKVHKATVRSLEQRVLEESKKREVVESELEAMREAIVEQRKDTEESFRNLVVAEEQVARAQLDLKRMADKDRMISDEHEQTTSILRELREEIDNVRKVCDEKDLELTEQRSIINALKESAERREQSEETLHKDSIDQSRQTILLRSRVSELEADLKEASSKVQGLEKLRKDLHERGLELESLHEEIASKTNELKDAVQKRSVAEEESKKWRIVAAEKDRDIMTMNEQLRTAVDLSMTEIQDEKRVQTPSEILRLEGSPDLIEQLTCRIEALIKDKDRLNILVESLRSELTLKDSMIGQQINDSTKEREIVEEQHTARLTAVLEEKEALQKQLKDIREDMKADISLSFSSPSLVYSDHSGADVSMELALGPVEDLLEHQTQLLSTIKRLRGTEIHADGKRRSLIEEAINTLDVQESAINCLQKDLSERQADAQAFAILQSHADRLRELAEHECDSNKELRTLLAENDMRMKAQLAEAEKQREDAQKEFMHVNRCLDHYRSWAKTLTQSHDSCDSSEARDDAAREEISQNMCRMESQLTSLPGLRREFQVLENSCMNLKLQKLLVLHVYSLRGEAPPGKQWKDEQVVDLKSKFRSYVLAVMAYNKFGSLAEKTETAINVSHSYDIGQITLNWRACQAEDISPARAVDQVRLLQKTLKEKDYRIGLYKKQEDIEERYREQVQQIEEKKRANELLEQEMSSVTKRVSEVLSKWSKSNEENGKIRLELKAEREGRTKAEKKLKSYKSKLEDYSQAVKRLRLEREKQGEAVKKVVKKLSVNFIEKDLAHDEALDPNIVDFDASNENNNVFKTFQRQDDSIVQDLRERRRRAYRLLSTLEKSANRDLNKARLQSTVEGESLAHQIEDYISGLKVASRKLERFHPAPLSEVRTN